MKDTFHNWKVCECIGSGAFGKVYRIVRTEFGHTYEAALKVLEIPQHSSDVETIRHEGMSEQGITEYFESVVEDIVKEFALMSQLKGNSHIVSYEDHEVVRKKDSFGWDIYIRMELLTPLYTYTEQHPMTVSDVIKMGIHLCKALELCESHHIIHRDIKPENIFVSNNGDFKLGDFGIARELEKTSCDLSKKGTKSYMAPEVYKGMEYNFSVDIYSLGVVLYRYLNNNRLPFYPDAPKPIRYSDKEEATLLRMCGKEMPKPCNASDELADIILKACAYIPSKRYESARDMREDLERVYQAEQTNGDEEQEKKVALDIKEEIEQERSQEEVLGEDGGEETACFGENEYIENAADREYTAAMFEKEENSSHFSYENVQEETVLLQQEKPDNEKKLVLNRKEYIEELDNEVKRRLRKNVIIAIGCFLILALIIGMFVKNKLKPTGESIEQQDKVLLNTISGTSIIQEINLVPNTVGMEWKQAKKIFVSIGLQVVVEKEYSSSMEKETVMRQSLNIGVPVQKGEQITLVVSKGKKPRPTAKPTEVPIFPTIENSTQETSTVQESESEQPVTEKPATAKPTSKPNRNRETNDSANEVQEWNPDE